jgi:hypothetical protein
MGSTDRAEGSDKPVFISGSGGGGGSFFGGSSFFGGATRAGGAAAAGGSLASSFGVSETASWSVKGFSPSTGT